MPRFHLLSWSAVVATCALMGGGCTRGESLYPVVGNVKVNEKPLAFGGVSLHPAADKGNTTAHLPMGRIDENGRYEIFTGKRAGAPAGWYRVVVLANPSLAPSTDPPKFATNVKYTTKETTDVLFEVAAQPAPNAYDLHLTK